VPSAGLKQAPTIILERLFLDTGLTWNNLTWSISRK